MKMSKEKRALIAGMIGCSLYVIGDFLFAATGKTQSTESIGLMVKVAYLDMATWRMVVSIICGVLGTALYYIGFHQMWKLLKMHLTQPKQQKWVKLFQIHDLMSPRRYGDMQVFVQKLRDMGYERVKLIDTTDGSFMTPKEARRLMLRGSTLLVGRK